MRIIRKTTLFIVCIQAFSLNAWPQSAQRILNMIEKSQCIADEAGTDPRTCDPLSRFKRTRTLVESPVIVKIPPPIYKSGDKGQLISATDVAFDVSVVDRATAEKWFQKFARDPHLKEYFKKPEDAKCASLAHRISILMHREKVETGKIFFEGEFYLTRPKVIDKAMYYHVAPTILVKDGDKVETYVIDPALFEQPVKVADWQARLLENPKSKQTSIYFTPQYNYLPQYTKRGYGTMTSYDQKDIDDAYEAIGLIPKRDPYRK